MMHMRNLNGQVALETTKEGLSWGSVWNGPQVHVTICSLSSHADTSKGSHLWTRCPSQTAGTPSIHSLFLPFNQKHTYATGLDTGAAFLLLLEAQLCTLGCCYGGELTAYILPNRELVSVPAHKAYAPKKGPP
jgi:hypothetical protein